MFPPQLRWGGVSVIRDGGVMNLSEAFDPSVRDYADISPRKAWGGE